MSGKFVIVVVQAQESFIGLRTAHLKFGTNLMCVKNVKWRAEFALDVVTDVNYVVNGLEPDRF